MERDERAINIARAQTFMGAYYELVGDVYRCLHAQRHNAQQILSQENRIRRLLAQIGDVSVKLNF